MEKIKARQRRLIIITFTSFALVILFSIALGIYIFWQYSKEDFLSDQLSKEIPLTLLRVKMQSRYGNVLKSKKFSSEEVEQNEPCTKIKQEKQSLFSPLITVPLRCKFAEQLKENRAVERTIIRYPLAFSLYLNDYSELERFFNQTLTIKELTQSKIFRDAISQISAFLDLRGVDLGIHKLHAPLLGPVLIEALKADAKFHYDRYRAHRGFVFSFSKKLPMIARSLLNLALQNVARKGFIIDSANNLIVELKVGYQLLYLSEVDDRYFFANSLEALINVFDTEVDNQTIEMDGAAVLVARPQAEFGSLLPAIVGPYQSEVEIAFNPKKEEWSGLMKIGLLGNKLVSGIYKGVFAAIPADVFAGLITSVYLPPTLSAEQWGLLIKGEEHNLIKPPNEAGVALIWDLEATTEGLPTEVGLVVAKQNSTEEPAHFKDFLIESAFTQECAGGTLFLASNSQRLIDKMRAACEKQVPSLINSFDGRFYQAAQEAQLLLFADLAKGLKATFEQGLFIAEAKQDDFQKTTKEYGSESYLKALTLAKDDAYRTFSLIPYFLFEGNTRFLDSHQIKLIGHLFKQSDEQKK